MANKIPLSLSLVRDLSFDRKCGSPQGPRFMQIPPSGFFDDYLFGHSALFFSKPPRASFFSLFGPIKANNSFTVMFKINNTNHKYYDNDKLVSCSCA